MTILSQAQKVSALRNLMKEEGVQGFIIPRADEYQGEYVPDCANRLFYISGFTGSAGTCVVTDDRSCVFSDGRYTIQLKQQVDGALFDTQDSTKMPVSQWLLENANGKVVGYDSKLLTPREVKLFSDKGVLLRPVSRNLIDAIWESRPSAPSSAVELFPMDYAGVSAPDKMDKIAVAIKEKGASAAVITLPDSIAWMLNIRSNDIPHIPVALSYAIAHDNGMVDWFIEDARVSGEIQKSFGNRVSIHLPESLEKILAGFSGKNVLIDGRRTSQWFFDVMGRGGVNVIDDKDPIIAMKAIKNKAEQNAMRAAHVRDGVAVTKFLIWFDANAGKTPLTERDVEEKLEEFRRAGGGYKDSSFDTIAGFGSNGAIVHYRATPKTNKTIEGSNLLLLDSGAQYGDGTTDITRTMAVGAPSDDMRKHYTLVLKGHIAISMAKFPYGTTGAQIDAMARAPLWQHDLDYAHGTGHGVGCYLSVHEEATSFSPRGVEPVEMGMIISNEPGYYREGMYGIRIENLVLAHENGICADTGKTMLTFETLTLAPYDKNLIVWEMLSAQEQAWVNAYHVRVFETLSPFLDGDEKAWLKKSLF